MQAQAVHPNGIVQYLVPIAVFAVIFAFRVRRMSQVRPLSLGSLWLVPAMYLVIVVVSFVGRPPDAIGWAASVVGLAIGAVLGWYRGKTVAIHLDRDSGALMQRSSPLAIVILLALVAAKMAARSVGSAQHIDVAALTDALLTMALGIFAVMRLEMYLRARRLLSAGPMR